jgi:hypothetical protein
MTCFLTVATGSESDLREIEEIHDCELAIQLECNREPILQAKSRRFETPSRKSPSSISMAATQTHSSSRVKTRARVNTSMR